MFVEEYREHFFCIRRLMFQRYENVTDHEDSCCTETDLAARFRDGDSSTFDVLFSRYKDRVYSLVYRTVGASDAEDVTQEVFVQVYRSLSRFRGESSLKTWIYRIVLNVCTSHFRRLRSRPRTAAETETAAHDCEGTAGIPRSDLESAIHALPEEGRAMIEMHYVQGMSYSEIADVMKSPVGTIKSRMNAALGALRKRLLPLMEEGE